MSKSNFLKLSKAICDRIIELKGAKAYTDDLNARLRNGETVTMAIGSGGVTEGEIEFLERLQAMLEQRRW